MAETRERVSVHLDAAGLGPRRTIGTLEYRRGGGTSVVAFSYAEAWLADGGRFQLGPELLLHPGLQYTEALPGMFSDVAPDRWGRTLLERREALAAAREGRRQRTLDEWDFLLGVDDRSRMGALRLTRGDDGPFLDDGPLEIPPHTRLRELEHLAARMDEGETERMGEDARWVAMLISPGSSLGGSRPKANFQRPDGSLWIAKFPSNGDRHDVGAWEYVSSRLAARAGVGLPAVDSLKLASRYHTFCAQRFDRRGEERVLYASAMTLAGRRDGDQASYLEIVAAIEKFGAADGIAADLEQLFRRVVFNILTANRDDHLRNHGFLRTSQGWSLSPAFDVNPSPDKHEHALAIDDQLRAPELEIVRSTAQFYRLSLRQVDDIVETVRAAITPWANVARDAGIGGAEIERLAIAFEPGG